jgi:hypothetical protein
VFDYPLIDQVVGIIAEICDHSPKLGCGDFIGRILKNLQGVGVVNLMILHYVLPLFLDYTHIIP